MYATGQEMRSSSDSKNRWHDKKNTAIIVGPYEYLPVVNCLYILSDHSGSILTLADDEFSRFLSMIFPVHPQYLLIFPMQLDERGRMFAFATNARECI